MWGGGHWMPVPVPLFRRGWEGTCEGTVHLESPGTRQVGILLFWCPVRAWSRRKDCPFPSQSKSSLRNYFWTLGSLGVPPLKEDPTLCSCSTWPRKACSVPRGDSCWRQKCSQALLLGKGGCLFWGGWVAEGWIPRAPPPPPPPTKGCPFVKCFTDR